MTIIFNVGLIHFIHFSFWCGKHEKEVDKIFDSAALDNLISIANFYEQQEETRAMKTGLDKIEDISKEELYGLIELKKL